MRALVTGGAGFIGSHLCEALVAAGHSVCVLDDLSSGKRENLAPVAGRVDLIVGDVRDAAAVRRAAEGASVVFHQAAVVSVPVSIDDPQRTHDVNIQGTLNVLLAGRATGARVVFATSAAVYGQDPELPKRETMLPAPISPYGVEKLTSEHYARVFHECYGLEAVGLRYFNVFGPRQDPASPYSGVISVFATRARAGQPITVYGDGGQSRDFVYVSDVVRANLLAATSAAAVGRCYNVGAGRRTTLLELLAMIGRLTGKTLDVSHAPPRTGDIRDSLADIARAHLDLGYAPAVDVETGLARLLASLP